MPQVAVANEAAKIVFQHVTAGGDINVVYNESKVKELIKYNLINPCNNFVGRNNYFEKIEEKLKNDSCVILVGNGGIGKTQIVLKYIEMNFSSYQNIAFIDASNISTIKQSYSEILNMPNDSQIINNIRNWSCNNNSWLFVFDNLDDESVSNNFFSDLCVNMNNGHIIITSRIAKWDKYIMKVEKYKKEEAEEFLKKRLVKSDTEKLAELLDYYPLAIEQAASYIYNSNISVEDYINNFKKYNIKYLEKGKSNYYKSSIATTWDITMLKLSKESQTFLNIISYFSNIIPIQILKNNKKLILNNIDIDQAISECEKYSIINLKEDTITIHKLVQEVILSRITKAKYANSAFDIIENEWNINKKDVENEMIYIEHVKKISLEYNYILSKHFISKLPILKNRILNKQKCVSKFLFDISNYFLLKSDFNKIEELIQINIQIEGNLNKVSEILVYTNYNLALVYKQQNYFEKAIKACEKAIEFSIELYKNDISKTSNLKLYLKSLEYQAGKLSDQDKKEYILFVKKIEENNEVDSSILLLSYIDIISIYGEMKYTKEVHSEIVNILILIEKRYLKDLKNLNVLNILAKLVLKLFVKDDYTELVRNLCIVKINDFIKDCNEPDFYLSETYDILHEIYFKQEKYIKAIEVIRESIKIKEQKIRKNHISIGKLYYKLGMCLKLTDNIDTIEYFKRASEIFLEDQGIESSETFESYLELANAYIKNKFKDKALETLREIKNLLSKNKNHELMNIPDFKFRMLECFNEIEEYKFSHEICRELLNNELAEKEENSYELIFTNYKIAEIYRLQKRYSEAGRYYENIISTIENLDKAGEILKSMKESCRWFLAIIYRYNGELSNAEKLISNLQFPKENDLLGYAYMGYDGSILELNDDFTFKWFQKEDRLNYFVGSYKYLDIANFLYNYKEITKSIDKYNILEIQIRSEYNGTGSGCIILKNEKLVMNNKEESKTHETYLLVHVDYTEKGCKFKGRNYASLNEVEFIPLYNISEYLNGQNPEYFDHEEFVGVFGDAIKYMNQLNEKEDLKKKQEEIEKEEYERIINLESDQVTNEIISNIKNDVIKTNESFNQENVEAREIQDYVHDEESALLVLASLFVTSMYKKLYEIDMGNFDNEIEILIYQFYNEMNYDVVDKEIIEMFKNYCKKNWAEFYEVVKNLAKSVDN